MVSRNPSHIGATVPRMASAIIKALFRTNIRAFCEPYGQERQRRRGVRNGTPRKEMDGLELVEGPKSELEEPELAPEGKHWRSLGLSGFG